MVSLLRIRNCVVDLVRRSPAVLAFGLFITWIFWYNTRETTLDSLARPAVASDTTLDNRLQEEFQKTSHFLGLIVPYRDAWPELIQFLPHMYQFLSRRGTPHIIIVVNQSDSFRFNRGHLINVGFLEAERVGCDYVVMHDVDILPKDINLKYDIPPMGVAMHLSSPVLHPVYHDEVKDANFSGGVVSIRTTDFRLINGMSTRFWGWGREDDEFRSRLAAAAIPLSRLEDSTTFIGGYHSTWEHLHDTVQRPRDMMKSRHQFSAGIAGLTNHDPSGLSTGRHSATVTQRTTFAKGCPEGRCLFTHIEAVLECNTTITPWCVANGKCEAGYYRENPGKTGICRRCGTKATPPCTRRARDKLRARVVAGDSAAWPWPY